MFIYILFLFVLTFSIPLWPVWKSLYRPRYSLFLRESGINDINVWHWLIDILKPSVPSFRLWILSDQVYTLTCWILLQAEDDSVATPNQAGISVVQILFLFFFLIFKTNKEFYGLLLILVPSTEFFAKLDMKILELYKEPYMKFCIFYNVIQNIFHWLCRTQPFCPLVSKAVWHPYQMLP